MLAIYKFDFTIVSCAYTNFFVSACLTIHQLFKELKKGEKSQMLDLFKSYRISLILLVCIVPLQLKAFEYHDDLESIPRSCEHEWVSRYFNSLDDDTSIEEVIDFLISFKA